MPLQRRKKTNCVRINALPHEIQGIVIIGEITGTDDPDRICFWSSKLESRKCYQPSQVNPGTDNRWQVNIPAADAEWFTMFENCCYEVTMEVDNCWVPFIIDELEMDCAILCLGKECEAAQPHEMSVCTEEVEDVQNCGC